jgi:hypothetical protein
MVMTQDGVIYILDAKNKNLIIYETKNGEKSTIALDGIMNRGSVKAQAYNLFLDREGMLWIGNLGFLNIQAPSREDPDIWRELIRPPEFVVSGCRDNTYCWDIGEVFQSSNGQFWFYSANGVISVDPKTGHWCKNSTISGEITEDNYGNLWLFVDNKLFKERLF